MITRCVIGLGHYSRVGKDTLANELVKIGVMRGYNIAKISFARPLKQFCQELYGHLGLQSLEYYEDHPVARSFPIPRLNLTPVQIWVTVGNLMREIYPDTWTDMWKRAAGAHEIVVVTDVRYQNEIDMIKSFDKSLLIKVVRPGVYPLNTIADQALVGNEWWYGDVFVNDTGIDNVTRYAEMLFDKKVH